VPYLEDRFRNKRLRTDNGEPSPLNNDSATIPESEDDKGGSNGPGTRLSMLSLADFRSVDGGAMSAAAAAASGSGFGGLVARVERLLRVGVEGSPCTDGARRNG
jgi:hypothetical protein